MTDAGTPVPQPTLDTALGVVCTLLLIRHGRSADVVPGSHDSSDPPLHEEGVVQAAALGRRLAGSTLDAIYSSHLRRAHDTARAVAVHHDLDVEVHPELEEVRLGDWSHGEFRRRAAVRDPEFLAWAARGTWDGIPNGEGDKAFRERVSTKIDELAARHTGGTIAVVAHGGVINAYIAHVLQTPRTMWMVTDNTSISIVRVGSDSSSVVTVNDCQHLYDHTSAAINTDGKATR